MQIQILSFLVWMQYIENLFVHFDNLQEKNYFHFNLVILSKVLYLEICVFKYAKKIFYYLSHRSYSEFLQLLNINYGIYKAVSINTNCYFAT